MVPNQPLDAQYITASFPQQKISCQLVFTTIELTMPERTGSLSEQKISLG